MQEYISEIDRCSAVLNNHQSDAAAFRNLRATLPAQWTVADGGQVYTVSTDWLAQRAGCVCGPTRRQIIRCSRERDSGSRRCVRRQRASKSNHVRPACRNRALELDHILSAKEFQNGHGPSWFDLLKARIYDWIGRKLEWLLGHFRHGRTIGNVIAWTVIALAALLLALWAVRASLRGGKRTEMDLDGAARPEGGWRDWLRNARAAAERGDYRAAIHGAYWAGVMRLEEVHRLPQDRARTPREALRLIRRESAEYAPLAQLTRRFELVWYGYRSATETDWSDAIEQLEKLGCLPSSMPATAAS